MKQTLLGFVQVGSHLLISSVAFLQTNMAEILATLLHHSPPASMLVSRDVFGLLPNGGLEPTSRTSFRADAPVFVPRDQAFSGIPVVWFVQRKTLDFTERANLAI